MPLSWYFGRACLRQLRLLVALLPSYFVMGIWDPGGGQTLTIFEEFFCIDEFANKVLKANLEGPPNSL
ncbi:hypothetical protein Pyn_02395 [Prunus yedoensis var. nudiflora]|uniref:Uncharacterized protein n=1 Tax=Prunus yedoensis var. nudiflora TaxID=2094558 RepID=A0A314YV21_PRUYE|nr:hypothetical protein Pyn_02395 [Prunus yedoensis var. nudiflora]